VKLLILGACNDKKSVLEELDCIEVIFFYYEELDFAERSKASRYKIYFNRTLLA
jgi:hypothetical protein